MAQNVQMTRAEQNLYKWHGQDTNYRNDTGTNRIVQEGTRINTLTDLIHAPVGDYVKMPYTLITLCKTFKHYLINWDVLIHAGAVIWSSCLPCRRYMIHHIGWISPLNQTSMSSLQCIYNYINCFLFSMHIIVSDYRMKCGVKYNKKIMLINTMVKFQVCYY